MPQGVELAEGDLNRPGSLTPALRGVEGVFLLGGYADMPGLLAEMRSAGVTRVVLLSSRSAVGGDPSNAIVRMWQDSERAVRASGVPWTILQPGGFMSNALRWLPQLRAGDVVRVQFPTVPIAAIDPADIAAVAERALLADEHTGQSYQLTGPEANLPTEDVAMLAAVLGRPLRAEPLSDAETRRELSASFPPEIVEAFLRFFAAGEFDDSMVLPTVQTQLGRRPRTFRQWAEAHADAFVTQAVSEH